MERNSNTRLFHRSMWLKERTCLVKPSLDGSMHWLFSKCSLAGWLASQPLEAGQHDRLCRSSCATLWRLQEQLACFLPSLEISSLVQASFRELLAICLMGSHRSCYTFKQSCQMVIEVATGCCPNMSVYSVKQQLMRARFSDNSVVGNQHPLSPGSRQEVRWLERDWGILRSCSLLLPAWLYDIQCYSSYFVDGWVFGEGCIQGLESSAKPSHTLDNCC